MPTHTHIATVNGKEKQIEVTDQPTGNGLSGIHFNYKFEVKILKTNWRTYLYRPGEQKHFKVLIYKQGDIISQAMEFIETDYSKRAQR